MATVAIIHAPDDALPARALAEKLRQAKLTVILEKPPGEELRNAVKSAQVTIALWSPRSADQPGLADEVAFARSKSKVIHASMQNANPPDQFRGDKSVNLTGWRGEDAFPAWRELAKAVTDKAGVAPLPPPAPRAASPFFQPGVVGSTPAPAAGGKPQQQQQRSAPPPRAAPPPQQRAAPAQQAPRAAAPPRAPAPQRAAAPPREQSSGGGGGRGLMIGAIVFVVVALAGGGGYYFWNQSQSASTTSVAWEAVDASSATALRAFLAGDPGDFRDEAQTALGELEERTFEAASDSDTIEAFENFLNDFPESNHAIAARGRIAELRTLTPAVPTDAALPATTETPDPDLVPPGTTPDATGGPAPLTPPAAEAPPAEPAPGPTN